MPTPREGDVEYIEINDFSPGIHSDQHAASSPRFTASDTQRGSLFGNGIARVDGTSRCHADKTGALVPLPKAQATGFLDPLARGSRGVDSSRPYRYVLDAQCGQPITDGRMGYATPQPEWAPLCVMWGNFYVSGTKRHYVIGREYRNGLYAGAVNMSNTDYDLDNAYPQPMQDFLIAASSTFADAQAVTLPVGSLAMARHYYGFTTDGIAAVTASGDNSFNPFWTFPVTVAMASGSWFRWAEKHMLANGAITVLEQAKYRLCHDTFAPMDRYSPAVGLKGLGPAVIGMQFQPAAAMGLTTPTLPTTVDRWQFHYSELHNVPQNNPGNQTLQDSAVGPWNPYMLIAHQGRIVFPDRRTTSPTYAVTAAIGYLGFGDNLLFFSDYQLPVQNYQAVPTNPDKGVANAAYGEYPMATMAPYNKMLVAEDVLADIGTLGVVTIDQLLVVKHSGGGAIISGDLEQPTIQRLPYIEPTRGAICKGVFTPVGFVYGSTNGIFAWQGGDATQHLSPQVDGFFWDHTNGSAGETYAGSRGRMAYWDQFVCVPNNYIYDVETKSWWRFAVQTLSPLASTVTAAYNCYDVDTNSTLFAFPYRHTVPTNESSVVWPEAAPTNINVLTIPDAANFSAPSNLDIRVAVRHTSSLAGPVRSLVGHWETTGNLRSYALALDGSHFPQFSTSTGGTAGTVITATCDTTFFPDEDVLLLRVTWRSSDGRVQFFEKTPSPNIVSAIRSDNGWTQKGANKLAAVAPLFNSTDVLAIGNLGNDALVQPLYGAAAIHAVSLATAIGGTPVVEILPANLPNNTAPASFTAESGQTVTVTPASSGSALAVEYVDQGMPPVWYTFDRDVLDSEYTWQSHPLLATKERVTSFQNVQIIATGASTTGPQPYIEVTLEGFDESGASVGAHVTTLRLALKADSQMLKADISPNFAAAYVTVKFHAVDPNGNAAPKIHSVRLGTKPRATIPRHG